MNDVITAIEKSDKDNAVNLVAIVQGGVLRGVYSDQSFNLNVIDVDNLKEDGFTEDDIDERIAEAIKGKPFEY